LTLKTIEAISKPRKMDNGQWIMVDAANAAMWLILSSKSETDLAHFLGGFASSSEN
jgi:hypothetical protein